MNSKKSNRLICALLTLVMILSLIPVMPFILPVDQAEAIGGSWYHTPAESNISDRFWVSATASSNPADAVLVLDGSLSTVWLPSPDDASPSLTVDLGGTYNAVRRADVVFATATTAYQYKLLGSADGVAWTALMDRSGNSRIGEGFSDVFRMEGLRYLKYEFVSNEGIGIKEISVFNYWRDDLNNGADISGFNSGTMYWSANNSPEAPSVIPDGQGGFRQIRGGQIATANRDTGNNLWGLLKDMGWQTIRMRIWHGGGRSESPQSSTSRVITNNAAPAAGSSVTPAVARTNAQYIYGAGLDVAIDFHYADNWADPQRQPKPYEWANLPFDDPEEPILIPRWDIRQDTISVSNPDHWVSTDIGLVTKVYQETKTIIKSLIDQGTPPTIVALGNEISNGMMWGAEFELCNPARVDRNDYFRRYIVQRGLGDLDPDVITDPRGPAPRGGGIMWQRYEEAMVAKATGNMALYEQKHDEYLDSVWHLAKLINAGQRAINELNEEYDLNIKTETHFANNVFEGSPKQVADLDHVSGKTNSLLENLGKYLDELGTGMSDRIGVSYYPDWHGTYDYVQQSLVELSEMFPGVEFNISECWNRVSLSVTSGTPTGSNAGWTQDPNVSRNIWNNNGNDLPSWYTNPNVILNGTTSPSWITNGLAGNQLPAPFQQERTWQGQDVMNIVTLINDVPNNVGQGVWPWQGNSSGRGYWVTGTTTLSSANAGAAGSRPAASFLSWSQGYAVNALEGAVYVTTYAGVAPTLPATVKSVDAKTGVVTDVAINWPTLTPAQYATPGRYSVRNVEANGTTVARSGPYWNGVLQPSYPIAGTMREVTAYITVLPLDGTGLIAIAPSDINVLNKVSDTMTRAMVEFNLSTASGFDAADLGERVTAGFLTDTYQGTTAGSTWTLQNRPDDTGRAAKLTAWGNATFADASVCCVDSSTVLPTCPGKTVTITGITLGGTEKDKYTLVSTTATSIAHITERAKAETPDPFPTFEPIANIRQDFMMGIDLSSEPAHRASTASPHSTNNFVWRNKAGQPEDIYKIFADHGANMVRARIWIDPYFRGEPIRSGGSASGGPLGNDALFVQNHPLYGFGYGPGGYGGGNSDIDKAIEMGLRVTANGMKLMPNFHYSDFWQDPGRNYSPKSWENLTQAQRRQALYDFTFDSLERMVLAGVDIGMVQIGNETQGVMSGGHSGDNFTQLIKNGCDAVDAINAKYGLNIKKAVHFTNPQSAATNIRTWTRNIINSGANLDVVLTSWYPEYSGHGTLTQLLSLLNSLVDEFDIEVGVGETDNRNTGSAVHQGYQSNRADQARELYDVIKTVAQVNNNKGIGVFYWEPAWAAQDASSRRYYGTGWASRYASHYDNNQSSATSDGNVGSDQTNKQMFATTANARTPLPVMDVWKMVYSAFDVEPTYGISLTPSANYIFPALTVGYSQPAARSITVGNTGNQDTGALTVTLSGEGASGFTLSTGTIASIASGGSSSFTVRPNADLAAGTYTATVTVDGDENITAQSFNVSFTVEPGQITFTLAQNGDNIVATLTNTTLDVLQGTLSIEIRNKSGALVNVPDSSVAITGTSPQVLSIPFNAAWDGFTARAFAIDADDEPIAQAGPITLLDAFEPGPNLLLFPSFEPGSSTLANVRNTWNAPTGSTGAPAHDNNDGVRNQTNSDPRTGTHLFNYWRAANSAYPTARTGEHWQSVNIANPGVYTFRVWVRNDNFGNTGDMYLFVETVPGDASSRVIRNITSSDLASSYRQVSMEVPITEAGTVRVGMRITRSGTSGVWIAVDDYEFFQSDRIVVPDIYHDVTWNADGGAPVPDVASVIDGGTIAAPEPMEKAGYIFDGWFSDADLTVPAVFPVEDVTAPMTFWAKWTEIKYYGITFNANGGVGSREPVSVVDGASFTIPGGTGFSRANHSFAGWSLTANGSSGLLKPGDVIVVSAATPLYAQWTRTGVGIGPGPILIPSW